MKFNASYVILIVLFIVIIIYVIVLVELNRQHKGIFAPYKPPPAPKNSFYPLGSIIRLTPEQQAQRAQSIQNSLNKPT